MFFDIFSSIDTNQFRNVTGIFMLYFNILILKAWVFDMGKTNIYPWNSFYLFYE